MEALRKITRIQVPEQQALPHYCGYAPKEGYSGARVYAVKEDGSALLVRFAGSDDCYTLLSPLWVEADSAVCTYEGCCVNPLLFGLYAKIYWPEADTPGKVAFLDYDSGQTAVRRIKK